MDYITQEYCHCEYLKHCLNICFVQEKHFRFKDPSRLKVKAWE